VQITKKEPHHKSYLAGNPAIALCGPSPKLSFRRLPSASSSCQSKKYIIKNPANMDDREDLNGSSITVVSPEEDQSSPTAARRLVKPARRTRAPRACERCKQRKQKVKSRNVLLNQQNS
jgi:hypothetical protein